MSVAERIRRVRHRTPRYVCARTRQLLYERGHPDAPWLTPEAVRLLGRMLLPSDRGLEFGSGRSTIWFAQRVRHLTSVEHDERWYADVSGRLKERALGNVDYILAPRDEPAERGGGSKYAQVALAFADSSLDFALIDGTYREHTARYALLLIKPGGILIIDNVNWYLPSDSRAPNSRAPAHGPAGQLWAEIARDLAGWRRIWTSSGVSDTAIFVRLGLP
ncbi:MAG: class I SAM-dependent methyltransferase [Streptosporangiaceae bacterium]